MPDKQPINYSLLKSVSRSFYTSLWVLPQKIRPAMSLGYLLCRTADTIADTDIIPIESRIHYLKQFKTLFNTFPHQPDAVKLFQAHLLSQHSIPNTGEGMLFPQLTGNFESLSILSRTDQALIHEVVQQVCEGMIVDLETFGHSEQTLKAFSTMAQLETYIEKIGGEPGRFWIKLCLEHFPQFHVTSRAEWIHQGILYGKGLQMVNILRDLPKDLTNGRCYIPNELLAQAPISTSDLISKITPDAFIPLYHQLIDQTLIYLENGLLTLEKVPHHFIRLRIAMWLPLIIGIRTLSRLRQRKNPLSNESMSKVSRNEIYLEMATAPLKVLSGKVMKVDFQTWKERAGSGI